jgi:hypothetical protein
MGREPEDGIGPGIEKRYYNPNKRYIETTMSTTQLETLRIPTSWKDVTICQFLGAHKTISETYEFEIDRHAAFAAALTGATENDILGLSPNDFVELHRRLSFVHNLGSLSTKWPKWFSIQGRIFKPCRRLNKLTAGQHMDMTYYGKHPLEGMHQILAVLCVPCNALLVAKKYDPETQPEIAEFFYDNLTMNIAYPIAIFYRTVWETFTPQVRAQLKTEVSDLLADMKKAGN